MRLKLTINNPAINPLTAQKTYFNKEKAVTKKEKYNVTFESKRVQNTKVNNSTLFKYITKS